MRRNARCHGQGLRFAVTTLLAATGCAGPRANKDVSRGTSVISPAISAQPAGEGPHGVAGIASPPRVATSNALAVVGGTVYTSPDAAPRLDTVVLVEGGKIAAIDRRNAFDLSAARILDASAGTVTAGFQNSHVHFTEVKWQNAAQLPKAAVSDAIESMLTRFGFTTVVDTASLLPNTLALRARIESGEIPGPRLFTAGVPLYPPRGVPYYLRDALPPDILRLLPQPTNAEQSTREVANDIAGGADIIKLFTGSWVERGKVVPMPVEVAKAAAAEAHRAGKLVFAHPSNASGLEIALAAKVDVLAHAVEDTAGLRDSLLARMRAANMSLIPTLKLFRDDANLAAIFDEVRTFARAQGRVVFGTDVGYLTDYDPTEEYLLLQRAGLEPKEILAALTTAPAELFGEAKERGRLLPGMVADLVVLEGNAMADVRNFARLRATVRRGVVIYRRP